MRKWSSSYSIIIIAAILFVQIVVILTFVHPLLSAHDRIVEKETELLGEISVRMEKAINEMSQQMIKMVPIRLARQNPYLRQFESEF